jgi:hypothetical protein
VVAHNPRLVWNTNSDANNPIIVQNPENSQAFYAQLK